MRRRSLLLLAAIASALGCAESTRPATADTVRYVDVVVGRSHSCGLARDGATYCWGMHEQGALGTVASLPVCFSSESTVIRCTPTPVRAAPGLSFESLSGSSCGLTAERRVFCWGVSFDGLPPAAVPRELAPGLQVRTLSAGGSHACALTPEGKAYCWGRNDFGQLGSGSVSPAWITTPTPVATELTFTAIAVGGGSTCALAADGAAYCWGANAQGHLGIGAAGSTLPVCQPVPFAVRCSSRPLPVAGGLTFVAISSLCGLTSDRSAYCWGPYGVDPPVTEPVPLPGGLRFQTVPPGGIHQCAVAVDGRAHCWGFQDAGELGNGSIVGDHELGVPVVGDLRFAVVRVGYRHACGVTTEGAAYCWGLDDFGQTGGGVLEACPPTADCPDCRVFCTVPRRVVEPASAP